MDPLTIAMLGSTALSGIGSLIGASSAGDTAAANRRIAQQNLLAQQQNQQQNQAINQQNYAGGIEDYLRRQQEFERAMGLAQGQLGDIQQGMTTAQGSGVQFIPGRGWVTTLGPIEQALQARNIQAGGIADQLANEFQRYQPITGERMSGLLYDKAIRGLNDTFAGQEAQGLRTATRQGNPRLAAAMMSAIGKQRGEALSNAAVDSEIQGRQYADTVNKGNRGSLASLYGSFAGQAAGEVGPNKYIPSFAKEAAGAGKNALITAMSNNARMPQLAQIGQAPQMQLEQPNNAMGSALASIGQLGYGAAKDYASTQKQDQYLDLLRRKYTPDLNWNTNG